MFLSIYVASLVWSIVVFLAYSSPDCNNNEYTTLDGIMISLSLWLFPFGLTGVIVTMVSSYG